MATIKRIQCKLCGRSFISTFEENRVLCTRCLKAKEKNDMKYVKETIEQKKREDLKSGGFP